MKHSYAKEKFGVAVNNMATGAGDIRERLWSAYLSFHPLSEKDFSDDLREDWLEIYNILTEKEPTLDSKGNVSIGRVQNSINQLDTDSCIDLAQKICDLNTRLHY